MHLVSCPICGCVASDPYLHGKWHWERAEEAPGLERHFPRDKEDAECQYSFSCENSATWRAPRGNVCHEHLFDHERMDWR